MKAKILVADDSATIQKIVAMAFEKEEVVVEGVGDGKKAFEKLPDSRPDVVLADTDMPGMNGYQLCKKIKTSAEFGHVRVLLLASDFEGLDADQFKECRADDHITKPFKSEEIIKKVKGLLQKAPARPEPAEVEPLTLSEADVLEGELPEALVLGTEDIVEPAMELSVEDILKEEEARVPAIKLEPEDALPVAELTADQIVAESEEEAMPLESIETAGEDFAFSLEDMIQSEFGSGDTGIKKAPEEAPPPPPGLAGDAEILDDMVKDLENLRESREEESCPAREVPEKVFEESLADIDRSAADSAVELERAFDNLKSFRDTDRPGKTPARAEFVEDKAAKTAPGQTAIGEVRPEPEDLLEKMAPSAFARGGGYRPDLIKESLSFLSRDSETPRPRAAGESPAEQVKRFSRSLDSLEGNVGQVLGEHIHKILEKSLSAAIQKEVSGLSETILRSVREIVREVAPRIAREIIKEEIEKIKDAY
ncbi:MAG: response regulator [Nitrospinae bacterium]|nr:response regulator [Nitrospinota bacterium]